MYNLSAEYYDDEGAYEKVIEESWKSQEIAQFGWPKHKVFLCNTALGNDQEATEYLKEIVSIDSSIDRPDMLDSILLNSGMEGILRWYINWLQTNNSPNFYYRGNLNGRIAGLYGFIGDTLLAMEYLEKAFDANETSLPGIKFDPNLILLREDPRFKAMLKEMGL